MQAAQALWGLEALFEACYHSPLSVFMSSERVVSEDCGLRRGLPFTVRLQLSHTGETEQSGLGSPSMRCRAQRHQPLRRLRRDASLKPNGGSTPLETCRLDSGWHRTGLFGPFARRLQCHTFASQIPFAGARQLTVLARLRLTS